MMQELKKSVDSIDITYVYKSGRLDNNHMIVVFSGYGWHTQFTYDFLNLLSNSRAHVLWIKDDFSNGQYANYYIDRLHETEKKIEPAIVKFIDQFLEDVALTRDQCTILGCSKGAAAAMYYGIKYRFANIVSTSPTLHIGSYLAGKGKENTEKSNAHYMFQGEYGEPEIQFYDRYIHDVIRDDYEKKSYIYLVTSRSDRIYDDQIVPFLAELSQYAHFYLIESASLLIKTHQDVAKHCAPLIQSLVTQLSFNLKPVYTTQVIEGYTQEALNNLYQKTTVQLKNISFTAKDELSIHGVGFIDGVAANDTQDISYVLYLQSVVNTHKYYFPLHSAHKPELIAPFTSEHRFVYDKFYTFIDRYPVSYHQAFFYTNGIDLSSVVQGRYQLGIQIQTKLLTKEILFDVTGVKSQQMGNVIHQIIIDDNGCVFFEKLLVVNQLIT